MTEFKDNEKELIVKTSTAGREIPKTRTLRTHRRVPRNIQSAAIEPVVRIKIDGETTGVDESNPVETPEE